MGRFGHPDQLRTLSIREAAMIQTFPKGYKFVTNYMKTACELVGNGLPPKFAEKAAKACLNSYLSN
jgi:DNA (cytosine-5)-methyltransferase 1